MAKRKSVNGVAGDHLRSFIERIERLNHEKAVIAGHITDVYAEARACGFDSRTMRTIVKLRSMDSHDREEYEALLDIYKGALGMLNGTPLGEAARKRLEEDKKPDAEDKAPDDSEPEEDAPAEKEPEQSPPDLEEARELARKSAQEGKPVTDNPYPARDPRRAAWDEEWCRFTGSDGMELPAAWRRKPKPKDAEGEE